jgi:predicted SprT family Zn-dependent metalloprotease
MFTPQEVNQYARLTFRQYGLVDFELVFLPRLSRRLGQANPWQKKIELSPRVLSSFKLFDLVLRHECMHCIQFDRMGKTFQVNGRNDFHGKVWKEVCKEFGVSPSTQISRKAS